MESDNYKNKKYLATELTKCQRKEIIYMIQTSQVCGHQQKQITHELL